MLDRDRYDERSGGAPLDVVRILDQGRDLILDGRVREAVDGLVDGLREIRSASGPERWRELCNSSCAAHPLRALIHESPFARRAFAKPRGYAGDAETLDLVYGVGRTDADTSERGAAIYAAELCNSAIQGIRERRDVLATLVDAAAERRPSPRVLSVACGHLREAQLSRAVAEGRLGAYFAMDQDVASLSRIESEQRGAGITTIAGSVKSLLTRKTMLVDLDLAYAAGLYDYLPTDVGRALTATLFSMLRPGGRVVIANCAPNWDPVGYMEAFMAWQLIYRSEEEVATLASSIPPSMREDLRLYRNVSGNVVFLEIVKGARVA